MVIRVKQITFRVDEMKNQNFEDIINESVYQETHDYINADNFLGVTQHETTFTIFYDDGEEDDTVGSSSTSKE